jgi:hypothetical protein
MFIIAAIFHIQYIAFLKTEIVIKTDVGVLSQTLRLYNKILGRIFPLCE